MSAAFEGALRIQSCRGIDLQEVSQVQEGLPQPQPPLPRRKVGGGGSRGWRVRDLSGKDAGKASRLVF